jgi:signal transduction histidine kinase
LTRRLLISHLAVAALVVLLLEVPLGVLYAQRERDSFATDTEAAAASLHRDYEEAFEDGSTIDPTLAIREARDSGAHIVLVDAQGVSILDSERAPGQSYAARPAVAAALAGTGSSEQRWSPELDATAQVVALPFVSSRVHGALLLERDAHEVDERVRDFWLGLGGVAAAVLALMAMAAWTLARSLTRPLRRLEAEARRFALGDLHAMANPQGAPPEVTELATTLNSMASRLEELLRTQRAFVADASHQLRTPLTALRLRLENIDSDLGGDDTQGELDAAIEETNRLRDLVGSLLDLARADEADSLESVDLTRVVADRTDTWSAVAELQGVEIRLDNPQHGNPQHNAWVRMVRGGVEQILDNLLDNALAVAPSGSSITVVVASDGDATTLTLADEGPGMTDAQKRVATERFWRGDRRRPGSGLGLSIVARLVEVAGGSLEFTDAARGGLVASVRFVPTTAPPGAAS